MARTVCLKLARCVTETANAQFATAKVFSRNSELEMGNIYDSPTWGTVVGRIESDGNVYDGVGMFSKHIGRVDSDGRVYDDVAMFGKCVGRVKNNGEVWTEGFLGGKCVGKVESDGRVYDDIGFTATCVGKVESPHIFGGGAALLLLIR